MHPDHWHPEVVDLPAADRTRRLSAAVMDEGVWLGAAGVLGLLFTGGIITAIGCAVSVFQDAVFGGGTSIGRRALDQCLVDEQGRECTVARGAARNALRLLIWALGCGIPLLVDLGMLLVHPRGLTLADLVLKTQVVDRTHARPRADQQAARQRRLPRAGDRTGRRQAAAPNRSEGQ